jgi:predicted  nucleic acid-binding Zn-ribbon protein
MQKMLIKLYEVQKIDLKLDEIIDLRGDLPQQIELQKSELSENENKFQRFLEKEKEVSQQTHFVENELEKLREELKRDEERLYNVKNNKEYDALSQQIKNHKDAITKNENDLIELKNKLIKITKYVEEYREKVSSLKESLSENEENLKLKMSQTMQDESTLTKEKSDLEKTIDRYCIRTYQNIRRAKKLAVATMIRNACSGCNSVIPLQKQAEIKDAKKLISCEVCGRIIVCSEEKSTAQIN